MRFSKRRLMSALHLGGLSVREAAIRTWSGLNAHELLTRAAAISFYAILALVPFLALTIALAMRVLPWLLKRSTGGAPASDYPTLFLHDLLPADVLTVMARELRRIGEQTPTGVVSLGLAALLWFSSSVFVEIIDALNAIRGITDIRPFWKRRLIAMVMTITQAAILISSLGTFVAWPQILGALGLSRVAAVMATAGHVLTVFFMVLLSFALALYFGPARRPRWEWITPGSLLGTVAFIAVSVLFRVYVQDIGNFSATYGSLGSLVVLMSWLWFCALELLVAAELNHVVEQASPLTAEPRPSRPWPEHSAAAR